MSESLMEFSDDDAELEESQNNSELPSEHQQHVYVDGVQDDRTVDELLQDIFNIPPEDDIPAAPQNNDDAARAAWLGEDNALDDRRSKAADGTKNVSPPTQDVQPQDPKEPSTEDLRKSIADRETDLRFLEDMQSIRHQTAMNTIGNIR